MSANLETERQQVFFSGCVQGVGFRYTTRRIASRHAVAGYVQNLPDGRVKVVAEGSRQDVGQFIQDIGRTMNRYIDDADIQRQESTGEFKGFDIRF